MITLYYSPGACSTANHFALEESGLEYQAIQVKLKDLDDPLTVKLRALNPMAQTPVLVLDDGTVVTQNTATLPLIADLAPDKQLFPERGGRARVEAESWLGFVASDLHATLVEVSWVMAESDPEVKARLRQFWVDRVARRLQVLEDRLTGREFILGERYSAVDGYAMIALRWSVFGDLALGAYPNIVAFMARVEERPVVRRVRELEGPIGW